MRWLRELVALAGALALAFAGVVLGATPSAAGGPTSVLLASPTSRETASLYGTDNDYGRLDRLLHDSGGAGGAGPTKLDEVTGHMINITWLAHDVHPWRVDRVYWLRPGDRGIWIETSLEDSSAGTSSAGAWHQPKNPARLRTLFTELGVMGESAGTGAGGLSGAAEGPAPGAAKASAKPSAGVDEPVARSAASGDPALGTGWWWAIPALALGLALGFCWALLTRRAAAPEVSGPPHEPRRKLIDL
ncbi:hypothetical protein [Streptomyces sp. NPDC101166]|uniref:hypothetical protein n=1 Tax=Streptomyces sp. NPDC101166 TaxID=3366120 RepID=UPI003800DA21